MGFSTLNANIDMLHTLPSLSSRFKTHSRHSRDFLDPLRSLNLYDLHQSPSSPGKQDTPVLISSFMLNTLLSAPLAHSHIMA